MMSALLEQAVEAHGGSANWKKLRSVSARLDIGGAIWQVKGQPGMFGDVELEAVLRTQRLAMTSQTAGWKGHFTPNLVRIGSLDGDSVEERHAPRASYE